MPADPSNRALDAMFWREEILQVLFWLEGERLLKSAAATDLEPFLQGESSKIAHHLERCRELGLVSLENRRRYVLTDTGREEGARLFADAFAGMQKQGHGECNADCVCYTEGHEHCPTHAHTHIE